MPHSRPHWRFETIVRTAVSSWLLSLGVLSLVAAQESPNYKVKRLTVTALAERLSSTSYRNTLVASEVIGTAGVCPEGSATHLGFWSVLGPGQVPVLLTVGRTPANASIDLSWTGQSASFEVYRDTSPVAVIAPENLLVTTSSCAVTDMTAADIAFYLVRPVAPGGR